jgi:hypothetical protein
MTPRDADTGSRLRKLFERARDATALELISEGVCWTRAFVALTAQEAEIARLRAGLDDISKGMIPPGLYNDDLLTDRQAFYHRMWSWSQERARAALKEPSDAE